MCKFFQVVFATVLLCCICSNQVLGQRRIVNMGSEALEVASGSSLETPLATSPLVKRSLAMMQADPLRTPPQAPPQPQYPAAQMAQSASVDESDAS